MPFIPHTPDDVATMLAAIGAGRIDDLFDEIPPELLVADLAQVPQGMNEQAVGRLMRERAERDRATLSFLGAGAYEHHIPAAVWEIVRRGEYYTAYTPYQAEASQGTLQLIYEYQSMMARLTGLDASNASMYDGATALAEALLMAVRLDKREGPATVLVPSAVHPAYRKVLQAILPLQGIEIVELAFDPRTGRTALPAATSEFAALVVPQPNFFGVLEDVDVLTDFAHENGALAIALVNPVSLALLKAPGQWGKRGADIACGDGQPLGVPISSGGPYFGFMCCKKEIVRQMPGRIVGRTVDVDGRDGFVLTLQAREQHIRRAKATSNICTNQGLLVTAATIYMSLVGATGLTNVAAACAASGRALRDRLLAIEGVSLKFDGAFFHEFAVQLPVPADTAVNELAKQSIIAGYALGKDYGACENALLVCATETKNETDFENFAVAIENILARLR